MNMNKSHNDTMGEKLVKALKNNFFDAVYFSNKEQATDYVMNYIKEETTVGIGGSMTIEDMELQEKIKEKGAILLDHNDSTLSPEEKFEIKRQQQICDVFLCSSNAVTLKGEIINIDGAGNRVSAMIFGPKKVLIIVGINKICKDEVNAFERLKKVACPKNNKRLNMPNPCVKTGECMNCQGETRICRIYSIIKKRPMQTDTTVVVVGEELGY